MRGARILLLVAPAAAAAALAGATTGDATADPRARPGPGPSTGWAATFLSPPTGADPDLTGRTIRATATVAIGGATARVLLTNRHGTTPLTLPAVTAARRADATSAALVAGTERPLTFDGAPTLTIPAGGDRLSDPVSLDLAPGDGVAVTATLPAGGPAASFHFKPFQDSFALAADGTTWEPIDTRPLLERVDVLAPRGTRVLVALGDSRTNGTGTRSNARDRWPDALQRRFDAVTRRSGAAPVAVVNAGTGGDRLLRATRPYTRRSTLARLGSDVLRVPGVSGVVVSAGGNDLTYARPATLAQVKRGLRTLTRRARRAGVRVTLATITPHVPFPGYDARGHRRHITQLNRWIRRTPGAADFDAAVRDRRRPTRIAAAYDAGDGLHPNPAGYARMAAAVPLRSALSAARPRTSSAAGER